MMNILVCNDDGYLAEGIAVLARVAGEFANVRVVAPERNRSGVSNSLTLDRPLHIRQAENGFYYVSGTPTDCIHLGLHALPDFKPDLVLSGVNHGANMGDDTLYSGTVAAATEAYLLGIPAVAFSLNDFSGRYWDTAEKAVWMMLEHLLKNPPKHWATKSRVRPNIMNSLAALSVRGLRSILLKIWPKKRVPMPTWAWPSTVPPLRKTRSIKRLPNSTLHRNSAKICVQEWRKPQVMQPWWPLLLLVRLKSLWNRKMLRLT